MSLDICISLSDSDLKLFVDNIAQAQKKADTVDAVSIVGAARSLLETTSDKQLPDFVATRLKHLDSMINMVEDAGFGLPEEDREHVLAALAYFASPDDALPDNVPVLGFLDDAIMIELCRRDLRFEIEAYDDFCEWRADEARARGLDPDKLQVQRADWADAHAAEVIAVMQRRRRDSYASGAWKPTLFKVS